MAYRMLQKDPEPLTITPFLQYAIVPKLDE
jgi:hypothetical protein